MPIVMHAVMLPMASYLGEVCRGPVGSRRRQTGCTTPASRDWGVLTPMGLPVDSRAT